MRGPPTQIHIRRGFMLVDVTVGLIIIGLVGVLLATSLGRQRAATQRLGDSRDAARLAEESLTRLQMQQDLPPETARRKVTVRYLPDAPPSPGQSWAEVTATIQGRSVTLTGAVPPPKGAATP